MSTNIVLDVEDSFDFEEPDPVDVPIGGKLYTARFPKDTVVFLIGELQEEANNDPTAQRELFEQMLLSLFSGEDAQEIMERLLDMADRRVSLAYVMHVIEAVKEHYRPEAEERNADLGVATERPGKQPQDRRRAAKKAPAKKTAAKTATAARGTRKGVVRNTPA